MTPTPDELAMLDALDPGAEREVLRDWTRGVEDDGAEPDPDAPAQPAPSGEEWRRVHPGDCSSEIPFDHESGVPGCILPAQPAPSGLAAALDDPSPLSPETWVASLRVLEDCHANDGGRCCYCGEVWPCLHKATLSIHAANDLMALRAAPEPGGLDALREARYCPDCLHREDRHTRGGHCVAVDEDPCYCVRMTPIEDAIKYGPEYLAHSFAMKFGLRQGSTFPQAEALERDLATFLTAALARPQDGGEAGTDG